MLVVTTLQSSWPQLFISRLGTPTPSGPSSEQRFGVAVPEDVTAVRQDDFKLLASVVENRYSESDVAWSRLDPRPIAAKLGRLELVVAVHVEVSDDGVTGVWTIVEDDDDATLDAVFRQELQLHDDYGDLLTSVEFRVLTQAAARGLALGESVYKRP